jgi:hypothetical protein
MRLFNPFFKKYPLLLNNNPHSPATTGQAVSLNIPLEDPAFCGKARIFMKTINKGQSKIKISTKYLFL